MFVFFGRMLGTLVVTVALLLVVFFLLGEVTVALYMHSYGVESRLELSEDFGFGMVVLLVDFVAGLIVLPFAVFASWRLSGHVLRRLLKSEVKPQQ